MENNEVSYTDIEKIVEDLKKIRSSLGKEISQNQYEASRLRDELQAISEEHSKQRKSLMELEAKVVNKRNELASIDQLLDKERKIAQESRSEIDTLRESFRNEQAVWNEEKAGALSVLDARKKELNRLQVELSNKNADLEEQEKQITGQLDELSIRRLNIQQDEVAVQIKQDEASKANREAEELRSKCEKTLSEAEAEKVMYEELKSKFHTQIKSLSEREDAVRAGYAEIEQEKETIKDRSREVLIAESKLREIKHKLIREIEGAKVEKDRKDRLMDETKNVKTIA